MTSDWLRYLTAATGCQLLLALFYRLGLARLTTFSWNRAYLLSALLLPLLLPLLAPPTVAPKQVALRLRMLAALPATTA